MKTLFQFGVYILSALIFLLPVCAAADQQNVARPGALNYVEGQVTLGSQPLDSHSIGKIELDPGQTLTTQNGKAELLLTPGVFVRLGQSSAATMISSGLTNTQMSLDRGEAFVEVAEIHPENSLRILQDGITTQLLKMGLYNFNADLHLVRVLDGEAIVDDGERAVKVKSGHMVDLSAEPLKVQKFDKKETEAEDLYQWTSRAPHILRKQMPSLHPSICSEGLAGLATGGIGIRGSTPTRFFQETASSTAHLAGASILPGALSVLLFSGVITITTISLPTGGDPKRITGYPPVTVMAFTMHPVIVRMAPSEGPELADSTAVATVVRLLFMGAAVFTLELAVGSTAVAGSLAVAAIVRSNCARLDLRGLGQPTLPQTFDFKTR